MDEVKHKKNLVFKIVLLCLVLFIILGVTAKLLPRHIQARLIHPGTPFVVVRFLLGERDGGLSSIAKDYMPFYDLENGEMLTLRVIYITGAIRYVRDPWYTVLIPRIVISANITDKQPNDIVK